MNQKMGLTLIDGRLQWNGQKTNSFKPYATCTVTNGVILADHRNGQLVRGIAWNAASWSLH